MRIFTFLAMVILSVSACSTLNIAELTKSTNTLPIGELQLEMSHEAYKLRVDLLRNITTEATTITSSDGTSTSSSTKEVPYHYLGMYIYEGVFLDLNDNLCFNLDYLIKKEGFSDFNVVQKKKIKSTSSYEVTKTGSQINCSNTNLLGRSTLQISSEDNTLTIHAKGLAAKQKIITEKNRIVYLPGGLFKKLAKAEILKTEKGYLIPKFGKDIEITQSGINTILVGKRLIVKNLGDRIEFIYPGILKLQTIFTLQKLKDGYVFYDKRNKGVRIKKDGNKIYVEKNGKMVKYYEINGVAE